MAALDDPNDTLCDHHIWFIDEILRNVLSHLPSGCESTLASCARVSKALSEPALDALWCKIFGLVPLLRLLPRSFVEVRNQTGDGISFVLQRAIEDDEWARFLHYALRVRKLHYHYSEGPRERLGEHAFSALVQHASLSGTTLLPNLQELFWLQFSSVAQCLPFLSQSLRRVTVYVQATPPSPRTDTRAQIVPGSLDGYANLLGVLDSCSPCVEELSLEGIDFQASESFASPITFKHLRALHLGSVFTPTSVVLSHCSTMPRLRSLSLVLRRSSSGGSSEWDSLRARPQRGRQCQDTLGLSALEVLRVAGAPLDIEDILHAVDSPALHTAALSVAVPDDDTDGWSRCVSLLSERFCETLRTVRAECTRSGTLVQGRARSFAQYLQPLLHLRRVRDCAIIVEDPAGVALTDEDVGAMAAAWSSLLALEVSFRGGRPAVPRPTVTSLVAFARHCSGLVTLRLPLSQDIASVPSEVDAMPILHGDAVLREFWMSGVSFSRRETEVITKFLFYVFPNMDFLPLINAGILHPD